MSVNTVSAKWIRALIGGLLFILALVFLTAGMVCRHKVYDPASGDFGVMVFDRITERDLVVDTTFGGVTLYEGKLISTYDRSAGPGKRTCPT